MTYDIEEQVIVHLLRAWFELRIMSSIIVPSSFQVIGHQADVVEVPMQEINRERLCF